MALGSASARPLELDPKSHAKGFDALRDHDGPPDERAAEGVIEAANAVGFGFGFAGHGEVSLCLGGGMALACCGSVRKQEGRPEGRPDASLGIETVARATCPTRGTRDGALRCFWGGF
jgi:hypothetical protein